MNPPETESVVPLLEFGRVEKFSKYVARQLGFRDATECPELSKLSSDFVRNSKGFQDGLYVYFSHENEVESLCQMLDEELERCVLGYFAFHWSQASVTINQVLSVGSDARTLKNMVLTATRDEVVQKVSKRLSNWKVKTLSSGGRLTLLKSVLGAIPSFYLSIYKMPMGISSKLESIRSRFFIGADDSERKISWVSWSQVMASKDKGGLGVGSFYAFNRAHLGKWVWRFLSQPDSLWVNVVKAIHGSSGLVFADVSKLKSSVWIDVLKAMHQLKSRDVDLFHYFKKKVGNGLSTFFWHDKWLEDVELKVKFHRIFRLDLDPDALVGERMGLADLEPHLRRVPRGGAEDSQWQDLGRCLASWVATPEPDRWSWVFGGSGSYTVADVRQLVDDALLRSVDMVTRWSRLVPRKVNILAWRIALDRIPTRINLDRRGIDIPDLSCPLCTNGVESVGHLFFSCQVAMDIYKLIGRWWSIDIPILLSFSDWINWFESLKIKVGVKALLEAVFFTTWWHVWSFRNGKLFGKHSKKLMFLFDSIVSFSFLWCNHRYRRCSFNWLGWLQNPDVVVTDGLV